MAVRRWQKSRRIYVRPRTGPQSAVRTSLVVGDGYATGSQRAYSLGNCAMGQTDGRIALFQNAR